MLRAFGRGPRIMKVWRTIGLDNEEFKRILGPKEIEQGKDHCEAKVPR